MVIESREERVQCAGIPSGNRFQRPDQLVGIVMARVPFFGPRFNIAPTQLAPVVCNEILDFEEEQAGAKN